MRSRFLSLGVFVVCVSCLAFPGCSGESKIAAAIKDLNRTNLQKLTNCYTLYHVMHEGRAPKSKEDLTEFISTNPDIAKKLDRMGVDREDFESFFTGSDGEPHVVVYGVPGASTPGSGRPIVFEAVGNDGVRIVGFSDGLTKEVDSEEEYNQLLKSVQSEKRKKK